MAICNVNGIKLQKPSPKYFTNSLHGTARQQAAQKDNDRRRQRKNESIRKPTLGPIREGGTQLRAKGAPAASKPGSLRPALARKEFASDTPT